jgi:hypothetical protein
VSVEAQEAGTATLSVVYRCQSGEVSPPKTIEIDFVQLKVAQENYPSDSGTTDLGGRTSFEIKEDNGIAYITGDPQMPALTAQFLYAPASKNVRWDLQLTSERTERGSHDDVTFPLNAAPKELAGDLLWNLSSEFGNSFVGGNAIITAELEGVGTKEFSFRIRGKNPADSMAKAIAVSLGGATYRYYWSIIQHETRSGLRIYNQFNPSGGRAELPDFGSPDGWGIAQVDYSASGTTASTTEVYNWRVNMQSGLTVLGDKAATTTRFFDAVGRTYPNNPEAQSPPASFVVPGTSSSFSAHELSTMVLYNGAGGTQSSTLLNANNQLVSFRNPWKFDPNGAVGQRWSFQDNSMSYAQSVISDEWEGGLGAQE